MVERKIDDNPIFKILKEVMEGINLEFEKTKMISVKRLRRIHGIISEDRSRINIYWRGLRNFEKRGIIELDENSKPANYLIHSIITKDELIKIFQEEYTNKSSKELEENVQND
ncbi:MAG: hypothetical protein ACFFDB_00715 [Promethearchaeota archaeon]